MAYTQRMPRAKRREQLLTVATEVFAQHGFHDASMDDIASEAGVSKPVLYQHFESKDQLFDIVTSTCVEDLRARIIKVLDEEHDRHDRVYGSFMRYFEFVSANRSAYLILARHNGGTPNSRVIWLEALDDFVNLIAESIVDRQGVNLTEAQVLARAIVGMAEHVGGAYLSDPALDIEAVGTLTARLAFNGLQSITASVIDLHTGKLIEPSSSPSQTV